MKRKQDIFWKQVTIHFTSAQHLNEEAWNEVERIERVAQSDMLYFARYSDAKENKLVVKVHTARSCASLKRLLGLNQGDAIVMPEPGSTAHAHAYAIAKAARKQKDTDAFNCDVIHWLMNMTGHTYLSETAQYSRMAYGGVQNLRVSIGEIKPDGQAPNKTKEQEPVYVGRCRKCNKPVEGKQPGQGKCPHCGGKAMLTVSKT